MLSAAVDGEATDKLVLRSARAQVRRCQLVPVAAGSALTGAGVPDLRAHLLGRISWVEALNPTRGPALRRRLARIDWRA